MWGRLSNRQPGCFLRDLKIVSEPALPFRTVGRSRSEVRQEKGLPRAWALVFFALPMSHRAVA